MEKVSKVDLKYSIITPVYNGENTISRTIESVLDQTYSPYEYFIIDGNSIDNTISIAVTYKQRFEEKNIKYTIISEPDEGIYDAMNKGIKLSRGDYIGIINSDDWYESIALETMSELYENTHFDMAYADIRMHNGNSIFIKKASNPKIVTSRTWNHPTQFVSREIYKQKLYQNKTVFDDLDMLLWIHKHGYKIETVNKILANFMMGGESNNKKTFLDVIERIGIKGRIYKQNGYSSLYVIDAAAIEIAKRILGKA